MRTLKNRIQGFREAVERIFYVSSNVFSNENDRQSFYANLFDQALKESRGTTKSFEENVYKFSEIAKGNEVMPNDIKMAKGQGEMETNENGVKRESNKGRGRFDLFPYEALEELARWYEAGAEKYGDRNWEKGISVKDCMNRMARHSAKACNGWMDEGPFAHLAAVMWNAAAAITGIKRNPYGNDFFKDEYLKELGLRELILTKNDTAINPDIFNKGISNLEDLAKVTPFVGYTDHSVIPEERRSSSNKMANDFFFGDPTGVGDHMPFHNIPVYVYSRNEILTDKAKISIDVSDNQLVLNCDFENQEDLEAFQEKLAQIGLKKLIENGDLPDPSKPD